MMNIKKRQSSLSVPRWSLPSWNEDKQLLLGTGDSWGQPETKSTTKMSLETSQRKKAQNSSQFSMTLPTSHRAPMRCPITPQSPHEIPNHSLGKKSLETQVLSQKPSGMLLLLLSEPFQGSLSPSKGSLNVLNKPWLDPQSVQVSHNLTLTFFWITALELMEKTVNGN